MNKNTRTQEPSTPHPLGWRMIDSCLYLYFYNVLNIEVLVNHSHLIVVSYRTIDPRSIDDGTFGGTTNIQVVGSGRGTIHFLNNTTIDALYAPGIKQSVLSEGRLTNRKKAEGIDKRGTMVL